MEFGTESGAVLVEADGHQPGARPVSRGGNSLVRAGQTLEEALAGIRTAAESALAVFRGGSLRPDGVELEFGVKLTAEAGAVIAKTAVEGHLVVRLSWSPDSGAPEATVTAPAETAAESRGEAPVPEASGPEASGPRASGPETSTSGTSVSDAPAPGASVSEAGDGGLLGGR
ncbi:CU044_2847 family protein [Streptomyces sp. NPDC126499]|uniref:CU044_2847 family protein n=1 Tax=Streptomyces sp. NPDC126499 TaxID=3155314 RepID=UPI003317670B